MPWNECRRLLCVIRSERDDSQLTYSGNTRTFELEVEAQVVLCHKEFRETIWDCRQIRWEQRTPKSGLLCNKYIHMQVELVSFPPLPQGSELISGYTITYLNKKSPLLIKNELLCPWMYQFCVWEKHVVWNFFCVSAEQHKGLYSYNFPVKCWIWK